VEDTHLLLELLGQPPEVVGLVDVQLEDLGRGGEPPGGALGEGHPAAEAGEDELGAFPLGQLGDAERDGLRREDAGDEQLLSLEQHGAALPSGVSGRARFSTGRRVLDRA